MKIPIMILALVVLVVVIGFIVPMSLRNTKEPFMARGDYIREGKQRYNEFADNIDVIRPNFAMAESPA